jgi:hypothetical protein
MRTNLEFSSDAFPPCPDEDETVNLGVFGKRLAEFIAEGLRRRGVEIEKVEAEDWGWRVDVHHEAFPLWIGCANYTELENGFLCFLEPSKPHIRRWLKKIATTETVERLATDLEAVIADSGKVDGLRWWTEAETARG